MAISKAKRYRNSSQANQDRKTIRATKANCHICGKAIDYTLKWPDPWCFVADHVVPLHRGGVDHISNKKAAHNTCNSKKRARLVSPIIRRSGSLG